MIFGLQSTISRINIDYRRSAARPDSFNWARRF